ncbi:lymphotactin-like isoform X2 [Pleurodeles waltl]|uniref:lymphotactin-like isoform X2 n=1 Tax=Pleurodeles waltl TaxID=8319 RepID=UPI0037095853
MKILVLLMLGACVLDGQAEGIGGQVVQKITCKKLVGIQKIAAGRIQSYKVQTNPIAAVILTLKKGKKSCVDPNLDWVKKVMMKVDKAERQKNRGGSTKPRNKSKKN